MHKPSPPSPRQKSEPFVPFSENVHPSFPLPGCHPGSRPCPFFFARVVFMFCCPPYPYPFPSDLNFLPRRSFVFEPTFFFLRKLSRFGLTPRRLLSAPSPHAPDWLSLFFLRPCVSVKCFSSFPRKVIPLSLSSKHIEGCAVLPFAPSFCSLSRGCPSPNIRARHSLLFPLLSFFGESARYGLSAKSPRTTLPFLFLRSDWRQPAFHSFFIVYSILAV